MIKILIVDVSEILIQSLKIILEQDPELRVVGFAKNGDAALEQCERLSPDIVLIDARIPLYNQVTGTNLIKEKYNSVKVFIMNLYDQPPEIKELALHGSDGYILKDMNEKTLIAIIKNVVGQESHDNDQQNQY